MRFVDHGLTVKVQVHDLYQLPSEIASQPSAATPVILRATSGLADTEVTRAALKEKLSGPNTSLILVNGDDKECCGRFFVGDKELELSSLSKPESVVQVVEEDEDLSLPIGQGRPVLLLYVEAVDQVWVMVEHASDAVDRLMSQLEELAKEGHYCYSTLLAYLYRLTFSPVHLIAD